jgi:hypothetical protein
MNYLTNIQNFFCNIPNYCVNNVPLTRNLHIFFKDISYLQCIFTFGQNVRLIKWRILNCGSHQSDPLFWKGHPQIDSVTKLVMDQSRGFFKHLLKIYSSKRGINFSALFSHFSQQITQLGSCHGESQALVEEGLKNPGQNPRDLISKLGENPRRIYHLQMLEMIRGFYSSNHEYIKIKELDRYDAYRIFVFDSVKIAKIHKKIERLLLKETNSSILFRRWQEGTGEAHSFMSHASSKTQKFWFYNSYGAGLYQYEKIEGLAQAVLEQLDNSFCASTNSKCMYYIQIYRHK